MTESDEPLALTRSSGESSMRAGAARPWSSPRSANRRTSANTSPCTTAWVWGLATACSTSRAAPGLALELAALRGASCAGIDASPRLLAVAQDRSPEADLRVGDMNALPWDDASFDVVTSFRGIWGTTPSAVAEAYRVLVPGGRVGLTVWGHIKASPGAWAFAPFTLAAEAKVQNQAAMVALGRPGAGEALLSEIGFTDVERIDVPFVFEFADPEAYARALASTGPAFEAIQAVGEESFLDVGGRLGATADPGGASPPRPHCRSSATSPQSPSGPRLRSGDARDSRAVQSAFGLPRRPAAHARGAAALRRRPARRRLRDERVAPLGAPAVSAERPVRSHGGDDPRRLPHLDAAGRARDGCGVGPGRLLLFIGLGQEARGGNDSRVAAAVIRGGDRGSRRRGPGVGPLGSTGGDGPERHHRRGCPGATRRRLR